jgi:hypothetical protein
MTLSVLNFLIVGSIRSIFISIYGFGCRHLDFRHYIKRNIINLFIYL